MRQSLKRLIVQFANGTPKILVAVCNASLGFIIPFVSGCSSAQVSTPPPAVGIVMATANPSSTSTPTPFQPEQDTSPAATQVSPQSTITNTVEFQAPDVASSTPVSTIPDPAGTPLSLPSVTVPTPIYAPDTAPQPFPVLTDVDTITFALLGSDTRGGSSFRTDTIIIAALRPGFGQVTLISIPRDLWVYIPTVGMQRVNTAYEFGEIYHYPGGGQALLKDTILYNLGIRVDYTALIDFDGFRSIVDTLGGLDVPVYCPYTDWRLIDPSLDPENENNWYLFTAGPGVIHMDGDLSLWYARSRKRSSDFDRGRRSQEVLRALYQRALSVNVLSRLPQLYADFNSAVSTDLALSDLLALSPLALHLRNADIRSYYISKEYVVPWMTPQGASVLIPNAPLIQGMLAEALAPSTQRQISATVMIEVRNGTWNPGWDALAVERLNYAGFETRSVPADRNDYSASLLYDLTSAQDPALASNLLAVLGLPYSALVSAPMAADVSYVLIVGADYQPCFNPASISP